MAYWIKIAVKQPDDPKTTEKRRSAVTKLITKHGGKDGSRARPGKYVVGVFATAGSARAFRIEAREAVQGHG